MIDVGVAGDEDDVDLVPAACGHLGGGERQQRGILFLRTLGQRQGFHECLFLRTGRASGLGGESPSHAQMVYYMMSPTSPYPDQQLSRRFLLWMALLIVPGITATAAGDYSCSPRRGIRGVAANDLSWADSRSTCGVYVAATLS